MGCCPDGKSYRRLNAIHLLLIGVAYDLVLRNCGRGERCLRLWISRFNEQGIDALIYRPKSGRPRKLSAAAIESEILPVVDDPTLAGQHHWTAVKLSGRLRQEKPFDISYRTLVRYLHEHNYARRIPRPVPEPPDPEQWARKREACAVEPATGQLVSLIVAHCNTEVFQAFLNTMAEEIPAEQGKQIHLVLDNAAWHKAASLNWHHIKPVYLAPYSPDFNPIERLWQHLKSEAMAGYLTKDGEALTEKLLESLQSLLEKPDTIRSVCSPPTFNRK